MADSIHSKLVLLTTTESVPTPKTPSEHQTAIENQASSSSETSSLGFDSNSSTPLETPPTCDPETKETEWRQENPIQPPLTTPEKKIVPDASKDNVPQTPLRDTQRQRKPPISQTASEPCRRSQRIEAKKNRSSLGIVTTCVDQSPTERKGRAVSMSGLPICIQAFERTEDAKDGRHTTTGKTEEIIDIHDAATKSNTQTDNDGSFETDESFEIHSEDDESSDSDKSIKRKTIRTSGDVDFEVEKNLREMCPDIQQKNRNKGKIYAFDVVREGKTEIVKIGFTEGDTEKRLRKIKRSCGHSKIENIDLQPESSGIRLYRRAEKLIHAELSYARHTFSCKVCKVKKHKEYFLVRKDIAIEVITRWRTFCSWEPYNDDGSLQEFWVERLRRCMVDRTARHNDPISDHKTQLKHWRRFVVLTEPESVWYPIMAASRKNMLKDKDVASSERGDDTTDHSIRVQSLLSKIPSASRNDVISLLENISVFVSGKVDKSTELSKLPLGNGTQPLALNFDQAGHQSPSTAKKGHSRERHATKVGLPTQVRDAKIEESESTATTSVEVAVDDVFTDAIAGDKGQEL